jgi:vancomycin resistance protein VanJ
MDASPTPPAARWRLWLRRICLATLVALSCLLLALRVRGEEHLGLAFLLYAPPGIWLVLLSPLALVALLARDVRSLAYLAATTLIIVFGLFQYRPMGVPCQTGAEHFRLLSCNIGQRGKASLQPFKNTIQPDVMVLQEAPGKAKRYENAAEYSEFLHTRSAGEFTLLSRHPITDAQLIQPTGPRQTRTRLKALAARFVVEPPGGSLAIYASHLHTPREVLRTGWLGAIYYGALGWPGTPWNAERQRRERFWEDQAADIADLKQALASETLPHLLAGDFNAPALGHHFHYLSDGLQDCHGVVGKGSGFTFPGQTRNPLSLFGPWLRLDAVLASSGFRVTGFSVESPCPAQHLAVAVSVQR